MKWYRNLKIGKKLVIGFLIVAILAVAVGTVGIINIENIKNSDASLYEQDTLGLKQAGDAAIIFMQIRYDSLKLLYSDEQSAKEELATELAQYFSQMDELLTQSQQTIKNTEILTQLQAIQANWDQYKPSMLSNNEKALKGEQQAVDENMVKIGSELREQYLALFEKVAAVASEKANSNAATAQSASVLMIAVSVITLIIAVLMAVFISRTISKPIRHLNDVAKQLAVGDTNIQRTNYHAKDEAGELLESFRAILDAIKALVTDTNMLTDAAVAGRLSTRADASKHQGDYKKIVEGINNTLDKVIEPVKEASAVLEEMAKGNLNVAVAGDYQGDHAVIKEALNSTINAINGYIMEISDVLGSMAEGNLDVGITSEYKGDFIKLKESINGIIASLNELMRDIHIAAQQVAAGTSQVSDGSQAISQGATEQAASIEELTSTITEIAAQTRQNAIDAGKANEMSETARENAMKGNEQMKALQAAMGEINESSASISKIIKVIDDIAFQTNILALNAAVEAARAGVHGKGFAVVAEEVRNLAARSAQAAKETTELIEGSMRKTEAGARLADESAHALSLIVESVQNAVELVAQISSASNQQASAIGEVNRGIEQMSQVVQTNSATSQEAAAAAEELSGQAVMLKEMVARFNLKEEEVKKSQLVSAKKETKAGETMNVLEIDGGEFGKY